MTTPAYVELKINKNHIRYIASCKLDLAFGLGC